MKNKKLIYTGIFGLLFLTLFIGVTYAVFVDKGKVLGSQFSVGSADLKLLKDVTLGTQTENLAEELTGPSFTGISSLWQSDYLIKVLNNGTTSVRLTTNANYTTANDPDDLRSIIFVEPFTWNDNNNDGIVDSGEEGASLGKKTIIKWKTEGYDLGLLESGSTKSLILRFSTETVSDTKQGKTGIFDFEFDSTDIAN